MGRGRTVSVMRRGRITAPKSAGSVQFSGSPPSSAALNSTLSKLFQEAYLRLCYTVKDLMPCQVLGVSHHVNIVEDGMVEILISAMVRPSLFYFSAIVWSLIGVFYFDDGCHRCTSRPSRLDRE